ncbi:division/cell wall cluster transcriptional repressor MraZ [Fimbriimonas ginsengisoli]|uniref:Transcriptional regulator MraZ n=1 Tax=Fimbriimonas ginsengisoli Gsoil 348 TaxID=661478 RepID=A0A068NXB3_FIMGI|nr:division/cell wall cluster transcriptional repressor MraZ [Fimbriimonas ginsengisoli]AIE88163.1 hypothetical protein OP10G_4795 [Fimbriimonas ginsengisoli Gsoil 348]
MSESEVLGSKPKPLLGTDEATIDGKGRILISKKKRDRLGDGFAICLGEHGCLDAYPAEKWQQILDEIDQHDPINPGRRQYTRLMLGNSDDDLSFDDQGRVVVPQKFRTLASLTKEVVIVGCGDHLEIWDKAQHEEFEKKNDTLGPGRQESIQKAYQEMKGA